MPKKQNVKNRDKLITFKSKMEQTASMIKGVFHYYQLPVLVITDSWFGNNGLWSRLDQGWNGDFHLLSRFRTNITLYDHTPVKAANKTRKLGRQRKYGERLGSVDQCAGVYGERAQTVSVMLYGKQRDVLACSRTVMLKTMQCNVRVVWVFRKTSYVALMTTDLSISS